MRRKIMQELNLLRQYIEARDYDKALEVVGELEEMSKEDKLNKIYSYAVILSYVLRRLPLYR
jgi:hypothetical protein